MTNKKAKSTKSTKRGTRSQAPKKPKQTPLEGPDRIYKFADQIIAEAEADRVVETGPEPRWETWVTFRLADEVFAFTVDTVHEIIRVGTITRVPHAPFAVRGIVNLRGGVVPVVDLCVRIGLPAADISSKSRILITRARDRVLGLLVDSVEQVARVDRNQVTPPPADVMTEQSEYILGVTHLNDVLSILLDPEQVLMIPTGLVSPEKAGAVR